MRFNWSVGMKWKERRCDVQKALIILFWIGTTVKFELRLRHNFPQRKKHELIHWHVVSSGLDSLNGISKSTVFNACEISAYSNFGPRSLLAWGNLHLGCSALVAEELGVHTLGWDVSLALGLLDTVSVLFGSLVVGCMVLWFCHFCLRQSIYIK